MFEDPSYKGRNFLNLKHLDGDALKLTYINGGVWLSPVGSNLLVAVRLFRCISTIPQLDRTMNNSILLNLLLAIVAFIARITITSSSRVLNTRGKPIGVLITLRISLIS